MKALYWLGVGFISLLFAIYVGIATLGSGSLIGTGVMAFFLGITLYSMFKTHKLTQEDREDGKSEKSEV